MIDIYMYIYILFYFNDFFHSVIGNSTSGTKTLICMLLPLGFWCWSTAPKIRIAMQSSSSHSVCSSENYLFVPFWYYFLIVQSINTNQLLDEKSEPSLDMRYLPWFWLIIDILLYIYTFYTVYTESNLPSESRNSCRNCPSLESAWSNPWLVVSPLPTCYSCLVSPIPNRI